MININIALDKSSCSDAEQAMRMFFSFHIAVFVLSFDYLVEAFLSLMTYTDAWIRWLWKKKSPEGSGQTQIN